jgi:D-alanine transaminase
MEKLLADNQLLEATIYLQITRGCAPRNHRFPPASTPLTVYLEPKPLVSPATLPTDGAQAILVPDQRWARCDIKSVALLPNVLAQQQAAEAGAWEALLVRDGAILEGSHSNVFFVRNGVLLTAPLNNYILPGISRQVVLELAQQLGIQAQLQVCFQQDLKELQEAFVTSTTMEVLPIVRVDGHAVGNGKPGQVTCRLRDAFRKHVEAAAGQGLLP